MKAVRTLMTNICSNHFEESKVFYTTLFDFQVDYDSDWFIHLISKDKQLELGIIDSTHALVPEEFQNTPNGFYITFVVDNVEDVYQIALTEKMTVISKPSDTFYGQRRLLLKDPNGALVDISAPIPDFKF